MTAKSTRARSQYHSQAYWFVLAALKYTQDKLNRSHTECEDEEQAHLSGPELLEGTRQFAIEHFGLMALTVFRQWGIRKTEDFGRIVFELVEQGEMRKTERDQLSDFVEIYDFDEVFDRQYRVNVSQIFRE